jgi:hypothetical protein
MTRLKPQTPEYDKLAGKIASDASATFTYAYGETPVIDLEHMPIFMVSDVSEKQFDTIEDELGTLALIRDGYTINAFYHDCGGYDYWKNEGEYMMVFISATITDISAIDAGTLAYDLEDMRENVVWIFNDVGIKHDNL